MVVLTAKKHGQRRAGETTPGGGWRLSAKKPTADTQGEQELPGEETPAAVPCSRELGM